MAECSWLLLFCCTLPGLLQKGSEELTPAPADERRRAVCAGVSDVDNTVSYLCGLEDLPGCASSTPALLNADAR